MSYRQYGIEPALVERVKFKLKNPEVKDRMTVLLQGVTKTDLQDRMKVAALVQAAASAIGENVMASQANQIVEFVLAQKINPSSTLHLIRLWAMFR
ncbi:stage VI sporulation protein F [Paenibacillus aestuarii]|uniref:Stage VI sporulation protein F n=1 Tax=Paenibacillus aestuarii TaxID=516965 RepID=A0ABW0KI25_9BACL|nr:stage VI sporulation protein F [Paenibacillus aestuarii]